MARIKQFSDGRDLRSFQETILGNYGFHVSKSVFQTKKFQIFSIFKHGTNMKRILNFLKSIFWEQFRMMNVDQVIYD